MLFWNAQNIQFLVEGTLKTIFEEASYDQNLI